MKIKKPGMVMIIADHEWTRFARLGYTQVKDEPKAQKPSEVTPDEKHAPEALEMTKAQIMAELDKKGIVYNNRANKTELLELLNA